MVRQLKIYQTNYNLACEVQANQKKNKKTHTVVSNPAKENRSTNDIYTCIRTD